ncbi:MAG: phosphoglycerate kinase [Symbiobacteriia bacterium]
MNKKSVSDVDVRGKKVLVRVDFNVPLQDGKVTDDTRIRAALPTIQYLQGQGARVLLASHLGRPKGQVAAEFSLAPAAKRLGELLGQPVPLAPDCVGPAAQASVDKLQDGDVLLLENVRFHAAEEKNGPAFARQLADLADLFVNDAFGSAHRAHASTVGVAAYLPAVAGLLLQKEIEIMGKALADPVHPFVAILGGAKVSDKIGVIENLLGKVDVLVVGGGMANTFLKAMGRYVGKSLVEEDKVGLAKDLLQRALDKNVRLMLPTDLVVAMEFKADSPYQVVGTEEFPKDWIAMDIGPDSVGEFTREIERAKTVIWNGPMGVFEMQPFAAGTFGVAGAVARANGITIVGGGDSVAAVEKAGVADRITHISTGGGASLEFLEGIVLPGVACLQDK